MVDVTTSPVRFHYLKSFPFQDRDRLKRFLVSLFKKENTKLGHLKYIFCSDAYLLNINRQHLKHDYYTDIITFNLSDDPSVVEGEVYISIDRVRDNARTENTSFKEEVHRVILHGALHLCGYNDKSPADIKKMRNAENKYLGIFFSHSTQ